VRPFLGVFDPDQFPTPIPASRGEAVEVSFYLRVPDLQGGDASLDHVQGFSMAVSYCCDLAAEERFDTSGTILEAVGAEWIDIQADNDPLDGDGCELVIAVLVDAEAPYTGSTIPPFEEFWRAGTVAFTVSEEALCGECCPLVFADGVNGRGLVPLKNLVVRAGASRTPAVSFDCEVCVVEPERFHRGDCNFSGVPVPSPLAVDVADAAALLNYLFGFGVHQFYPPCLDACDADDDGLLNAMDAVAILGFLFQGGAPPPAPGPGLELTGEPNPNGVRCVPPGPDPTEDFLDCWAGGACFPLRGGGGGFTAEICDNFVDDDQDGLTDLEDPDCQIAFAAGAPGLGPFGEPAPPSAAPGGATEVSFWVKTPEDNAPGAAQFNHIHGLAMALQYDCRLAAAGRFDIAGTILEALAAEFVTAHADNDPTDGDGCELVIGVLIEALAPAAFLERRSIAPLPGFQHLGSVEFRVADDVPCGEALDIQFADGVNGRHLWPVANLVSTVNWSRSPQLHSTALIAADVDSNLDGIADTCAEPLSLDGEALSVTLTPEAPKLLRRFAAPPGEIVIFTLEDPDPLDANALYIAWGAPPTAGRFDQAADARGEPAQRLVIPAAQGGAGYVLVQGNTFHEGANQVTLRGELARLGLESLSATFAGRGGTGEISASVLGGGFDRTTAFFLEMGPARLGARDVVVIAGDRAEMVFDVGAADFGPYDLVAEEDPGGPAELTARLAAAFEVVETNVGPLVEAELTGVEEYRYDRHARLALRYRNPGDAEVPAPLFKVVGPPGTELRLAREERFGGRELQVLGFHPNGVPGKLPPGAEVEVPLVFRSTSCRGCPIDFDLFVFTPPRSAPVAWDTLRAPAGMSPGDWERAWPSLSTRLGATWTEYAESLGALATRLARRGVYPGSVESLLRFAVGEALGRPAAAALGRVVRAGGAEPLAGGTVTALAGGVERSSAVTDEAGAFALSGLEPGAAYELAVPGHRLVATPAGGAEITVPLGGDVLALELTVEADPLAPPPGDPAAAFPGPSEDDLPEGPIIPPDGFFTDVDAWGVTVVSSWDPNEKRGPDGEEPGGLVPPERPLEYTIYFENKPAADAAAQEVVVIDRLDSDLDCTTVELLDVQIGNVSAQRVALDAVGFDLFSGETRTPGAERFQASTALEVTNPSAGDPAALLLVDLDVTRTTECSELRWTFALVTPVEDPRGGFLPPNCAREEGCDCASVPERGEHPCRDGRGEGHVSIRVWPLPDLPEGTELINEARVLFDGVAEPASVWRNEVSYFLPPAAPGEPRPADGAADVDADVALQWEPGGAGTTFDVFFGPLGAMAKVATGEPEPFFKPPTLDPGTTYEWTVEARKGARSARPPASWTFTTARECEAPAAPASPSAPKMVVLTGPIRLDWEDSRGATSYDVFLWPESEARPAEPIAAGIRRSEYEGPLRAAPGRAAYLWQVVARDGACATEGPLWRFTSPFRPFQRGNVDRDPSTNITDAIVILGFLFLGSAAPLCREAANVDGEGLINLTDAVYLLNHLFLGGPAPPAPYPGCGLPESLGPYPCAAHAPCAEA
jgi:hypothetical protein